jgi:dinuclear metal center YbgI/SA1388 family protein
MKTQKEAMMPATRQALSGALEDILQPGAFKDYGPNGLQVEGRCEVRKLVTGVTASLALIDAAVAAGADAILVHHGLFWRGQDGRVTGWMKQRLQRLLTHDINLLAYHLPLDAHAELGNNAQLGQVLGLPVGSGCSHFGDQDLGWMCEVETESLQGLASRVRQRLSHEVVSVPGDGRALRRVAWCSGGAQGYFEAAIAAGADVFITGEISEPQAHYARETGVAYIACGHHATERYGAPAVGAHVAQQLGIEHEFIDVDNPA